MKKTCLFVLWLVAGVANAQERNSGLSEMRDPIMQYQADVTSLERTYSVRESDEFYARFGRFYSEWLKKLKDFPFDTFSQNGKVDYVLLRNQIEKDAYFLQQKKAEFDQIKNTIPFADKIMALVRQRRVGKHLDAEQAAKALNELKKNVQSVQKELEKLPKPSERISKKAVSATREYRKAINEFYSFYNEYDPLFGWWTQAPHTELDSAFSSYERFLKTWKASDAAKDDGSGIVGNPIGREQIIKSLETEFISYTPEELIAIANKEFAWCEKEMLKASQEMGFGNNWKEALEKVKNDHVEPGQQPEFVAFLANEAIDYLQKNDLVTVPDLAKEDWGMKMLSAQEQKFNPFFLGGDNIYIAFPTAAMAHEDKLMSLRGNNKHFARATVFHELIPGHHLQGFMVDRYNPHRQLFYTPFWIEGWALYWEMILWEKNFQKSPENRVGMLFWRMHRCARIIFSLNYHLGNWAPQQCIDFLVDKVGHERANATAEVRRSFTGGYGPLYQLAYMIGAKEFYALRGELVNSGKMKEKDFHDTILQSGPISIELLRALITQQPLTRDFKTQWKFGY